MTRSPVVTVSLDNSLVRGDSLTLLARYLQHYGLCHGKFSLTRRIFMLRHRRSNADISMRRFKFELMRIVRSISKPSMDDFAAHLAQRFNPDVVRMIGRLRDSEGAHAVLLTSAPEEYASRVAALAGFSACIATRSLTWFRQVFPSDPIDYIECAGMEKLHRLDLWLDENNADLHTVITGEADDLPLLRRAETGNRYLTAPLKTMRRMLRREGVIFESL